MHEPILIIVYGGVVQHVDGILPGMDVVVRDYDVDPKDDPGYPRDDNGDPFSECVWAGESDHANKVIPNFPETGFFQPPRS